MKSKNRAIVLMGAFVVTWNQRFLSAANDRGLRVLLMEDPSIPCEKSKVLQPGAIIADISWKNSTDLPAVLRSIDEWLLQYEIVGVMALRDTWVEPAAVVADMLDLPSIGLRAARVCRNKQLQRMYLKEWSPDYTPVMVGCEEDFGSSWTEYPSVLKPLDRSGSFGVRRVNTRDEAIHAMSGYQQGEPLLMESLVRGREFTIETLMQEGRIIFTGSSSKITSESEGESFVEFSHTVPAVGFDNDTWERAREVNASILAKLDFRNGIAHAEYRLTDAGSIYLMEVNSRAPGDGIIALYGLATGEPLENPLIDISIGAPASYSDFRRFVRQIYLSHVPGILRDVVVDGATEIRVNWLFDEWGVPALEAAAHDEPARLREVTVSTQRDSLLREISNSFERSVYFILDSPDVGGLDALEYATRRLVRIVTEPVMNTGDL